MYRHLPLSRAGPPTEELHLGTTVIGRSVGQLRKRCFFTRLPAELAEGAELLGSVVGLAGQPNLEGAWELRDLEPGRTAAESAGFDLLREPLEPSKHARQQYHVCVTTFAKQGLDFAL